LAATVAFTHFPEPGQIQAKFHTAGVKALRPVDVRPTGKFMPLEAHAQAVEVTEKLLPPGTDSPPEGRLGSRGKTGVGSLVLHVSR
jgi:hypothetical protein